MKDVLLLGSGSSFERRIKAPGDPNGASWAHVNLTRLDINQAHQPDIVWDLNKKPWPIRANSFDRVDAYEVLEHLGRQGDYKAFFEDFHEIWRILKPKGILGATVPSWRSEGALGDPSHTRVINRMSLLFLDQSEYANVGKSTMSDFRFCWNGDFKTVFCQETEHTFGFILEAVKPARASD